MATSTAPALDKLKELRSTRNPPPAAKERLSPKASSIKRTHSDKLTQESEKSPAADVLYARYGTTSNTIHNGTHLYMLFLD